MDVVGEKMVGKQKIVSEGVVLRGKWWHPKRSGKFKRV
jgi:dihydroorotase